MHWVSWAALFAALFFWTTLLPSPGFSQTVLPGGISEEELAEHYFPQAVWFHPMETCAWPASADHPGVSAYSVRSHPQAPDMLTITYTLLYRDDCGGIFGIDPHPGDVEGFSCTLVEDASCGTGWRLFSVKSTAHGGALRDLDAKIYNSCQPLPEIFVSLRKHGTYLTIEQCNANIDPTQRCQRGYAADFVLMNAGDPETPILDDLTEFFPPEPGASTDYIWSGDGRFCGGQHVENRIEECVAAPGQKLTDDGMLAAFRREETVVVGMGDSLTHGTLDATNNDINTLNAYLQKVGESLGRVTPVLLTHPLFDLDSTRIDPFAFPTNLGVDGSDIFSIEGVEYYKRVGEPESFISSGLIADRWLPSRLKDVYDKVLYPYPLLAGKKVSILEASAWLTGRGMPLVGYDRALAFLWSGNNDSSLAALGAGGRNPAYQPLPFDAIKYKLKPALRLLLGIGEAAGDVSFEPYTQSAVERNLTDLEDFFAQYEHVLTRFLEESAGGGVETEVFLMTLPYYSAVGYLMDSDDLLYYLRKVNPGYRLPATFKPVAPPGQPITDPLRGDRVSLLTFGMMYAMLETGDPVWRVNRVLQTNGKQRDGMVLSEAERLYIMDRIDGYNEVIRDAAFDNPEVHLIDIGRYLNDVFLGVQTIEIGGRTLTRKWSRGCGFSLDGVHPGYTGHALIANFILEGINETLGIGAPPLDLAAVLATDPYCDQDMDGWVPGPGYEPAGLTKLLFLFTDPDDADPSVGAEIPDNVWDVISDVLLGEILRIPALREEALRRNLIARDETPTP